MNIFYLAIIIEPIGLPYYYSLFLSLTSIYLLTLGSKENKSILLKQL